MKKEDLTILYKAGLISSKPFFYIEIKDKIKQYVSQGMTKTEAVTKVSNLTGVSSRTVWIALNATKGIDII